MKKYKIQKVMVTKIFMNRVILWTKERMEAVCKKFGSINDDLESVFEALQVGKEPKGFAWSHLLPKLTQKEMKLVEIKDPTYLQTFSGWYPDVKEAEMKLSQSDSKFVEGFGQRYTFTIENSS